MVVIPFSQITEQHLPIVGRKGYSLGQLVQGKFPVPEGFVLSSEAFAYFIQETDIGITIQSELNKVKIDDLHSVDYASRLIQDLILGASLTPELQTVVMQQFAHIPSDYVAIRSSAFSTQHEVAWAGELATFLQVTPLELPEKIKACWASLFSTRSLYYFLQQKLDIKSVNIAVIVQKMVDATASGIAYSVHPVTRDKDQVVIEAEHGLGDVTESGELMPDTYVVNLKTESILDKNIHSQSVIIEPADEGTVLRELDESTALKQKIADENIIQLAKKIKEIETFVGYPVDVEWVLAEDLSFLQLRRLNID